MPLDFRHRLLAWLFGLLEVLFSLAAGLWLLCWPAAFHFYYPRLGISPHEHDAQAIVDWLGTHYRERSLSLALVDGNLEPKELRHYSDVRRFFHRLPTLIGATALTWGLLLALSRPSIRLLLVAQQRGLLLWLGVLLVLGGLALWDWPLLFASIHQPLFGDKSWRFPNSAYSLQLFPTGFWKDALLALMAMPVLFLAGAWMALGRIIPPPPAPTASFSTAAAIDLDPGAPEKRKPIAP